MLRWLFFVQGRGSARGPRVPVTKEEEEELIEVTVRHMSGRKELQARIERRDELCKSLDELLFKRRSWAATLANHVFAHRASVANARHHQLRVGWKEGEPLRPCRRWSTMPSAGPSS